MGEGRRTTYPGRSWSAGGRRDNGAEAPISGSARAAACARCSDRAHLGAAILVALVLDALIVAPAAAHGLFRDGEPADLVADMLINFAVPLVVLTLGAVVGIALSKWLARNVPEDTAEDAEPAERDDSVNNDEATVRRT
jgi:hypothetical protein